MQVLLIFLAVGIFLHDAVRAGVGVGDGGGDLPLGEGWLGAALVVGLSLGAKGLLGAWYGWGCRRGLARLGQDPARTFKRLHRKTMIARLMTGGLYGADLMLGLLVLIRERVVDTVLVDELLVMGPTLGLVMWLWWAYYPVERRLLGAGVFARVESGEPVYPVPSRGGYVVGQCRHTLMLLLGPLVLIVGWVEAVRRMEGAGWLEEAWVGPVTGVGAGAVFLLAPLMIRYLWDTVPLPPGPTRKRLVEMCKMHAVPVRELLLWRTFNVGGVLNAGVMGVIGPLRYILLSDALLERLTPEGVEAVMAHELAHAKRKHMIWLPVAAIGSLGVLELVFGTLTTAAAAAVPAGRVLFADDAAWGGGWFLAAGLDAARLPEAGLLAGTLLAVAAWLPLFGWVSRRFERQADAFAAQHLSRTMAADAPASPTILPAAAAAMIGALQRVADLNHIPVDKPSWRHGSIAWRQAYLRSLIGQPADALRIDRDMRWLQLASALCVGGVVAAATMQ